jgi:hypothetical protein
MNKEEAEYIRETLFGTSLTQELQRMEESTEHLPPALEQMREQIEGRRE